MELVNGLYNKDMTMFVDPYQNGVQRFDKLYKYMQMAVKGLGDNTSSAMEVAQALYVIKNLELYRDYPVPGTNGIELYKDFDSFCKDCFKAKKSTIYNYIALYKRFGADSGNKSEQISPYIKDFTYTQLLLMLPLSDAELSLIKPDWTCSQIKKHVKDVKTKNDENSKRLEKSSENKKISLVDLFNEIKMIFVSVSHMEMDSSSKEMFYRGYLTALSSLLSKLNLDLDDEMRRIYRGVISNE